MPNGPAKIHNIHARYTTACTSAPGLHTGAQPADLRVKGQAVEITYFRRIVDLGERCRRSGRQGIVMNRDAGQRDAAGNGFGFHCVVRSHGQRASANSDATAKPAAPVAVLKKPRRGACELLAIRVKEGKVLIGLSL